MEVSRRKAPQSLRIGTQRIDAHRMKQRASPAGVSPQSSPAPVSRPMRFRRIPSVRGRRRAGGARWLIISRSKCDRSRSSSAEHSRLGALSQRISSGSNLPYRVRRANAPPDCLLRHLTPVDGGRVAGPRLAADVRHWRAFSSTPPQNSMFSRVFAPLPAKKNLADNSRAKRSSCQGAKQ